MNQKALDLAIAGPRKEDVQQADLTSCLSAVARRVQSAEEVRLYEQDGTPSRRDYEIAVTCSVHRSADDPA